MFGVPKSFKYCHIRPGLDIAAPIGKSFFSQMQGLGGQLIKTTVYLNEGEFTRLKRMAKEDSQENLAGLIRQAVKNFFSIDFKNL